MEHTHHKNHGIISKLKSYASYLEKLLAPFFRKAPHLPEGGRKFITTILPWFILIVGIVGLLGLLGSGLLGILLSPIIILKNDFSGIILFTVIILSLISIIFALLSFKPLRGMKKSGWDYLFYSLIVSTISSLLSIVALFGGIGDIAVLFVVAYILFEVHEKYH